MMKVSENDVNDLFLFIVTNFVCCSGKKSLGKVDGLEKIHRMTCPALWLICFKDPMRKLAQCIVSSPNWNPSNFESHVKHRHKREEAPELFIKKENLVMESAITALKRSSEESTKASSGGMKDHVMTLNKKELLDDFRYKFYRYLTQTGSPINAGSSEEFKKLLDFILGNVVGLRKYKDDCRLTRDSYYSQQLKSSATTIHVIRSVVSFTRAWLMKRTKKHVPFLYVSHDVWESIQTEILGVSIHLVVPEIWRAISIPIGLKECHSKKAVAVAEDTNIVLER